MTAAAVVAAALLGCTWLLVLAGVAAGPAVGRRRREQVGDALLFHNCSARWWLALRALNKRMPSDPRCILCLSPFRGIGPLLGVRPWRKNPRFCAACAESSPVGGHNLDIGVLYADIRGFTAMAEGARPEEAARILDRFYRLATQVLVDHDAVIDKLEGDGIIALFLPQLTPLGARTCDVMLTAAERLLDAAGRGTDDEPVLPLGVALHYGPAFVGNVGAGVIKDFTAVGDVINTAERLQRRAGAGQIVLSEEVYGRVAGRYPAAKPLSMRVKGRSQPVSARRVSRLREV